MHARRTADALAAGLVDDPAPGVKPGVEPGEENAEWLRSTFREDGQAGKGRTACRSAIVQPDRWDFLAERRAGLSIVVLRLVTPGSDARRSRWGGHT